MHEREKMKYIYTVIILMIIFVVGIFLYQQQEHTGTNSQRIDCHKTYTVFEKTYNDTFLKKVQDALLTGEYTITSSIKKSKYMPTRLFNYVNIEEVDQLVKDAISQHKILKPKTVEKVELNYYIYENDKADPGKKTQKSKLYAGYLRFTFTYQGIKAYAVQVDFMDPQGRDIDKSVQCAIESAVTAS